MSGTRIARSRVNGRGTRANRPGTMTWSGVREQRAHLERAAVGIDLVADVIHPAGMRKTGLRAETEEGHVVLSFGRDRALLALQFAILQDEALAGGEAHVGRIRV